jgi:hypothetical protein
MEEHGFIREKLDIKILILFVLSNLSGRIDPETLADLCLFDTAVGYFDYIECLDELTETDHVENDGDGYIITEKGRKNAEAVSSSLPYSVRSKALRLIEPVDERLRREAMIRTSHSMENNICTVSLSMADSQGEILEMKFICADEEQAGRIKKKFRREAERIYGRIIELFEE